MNRLVAVVVSMLAFVGVAAEREYIWHEGMMPDIQISQFARMTDEEESSNRVAYIEWLDKPANPNGGVIIMISGGGYNNCCDTGLVRDQWPKCSSST